MAVTNNVGAATQVYTYSPYGMSGEGDGDYPFRFTGQKLDLETGLYYYKARYYSPELGRFLQTDPIGYADQMNLYAYVGNDPVNMTDPSGLCSTGSRIERAESVVGCHIAYGAPSRPADPEGENRHTVQTHYQDGSGEDVYYDPEVFNIGADEGHGGVVQNSANGGEHATIQNYIQGSLDCGCAVDVSFETAVNTNPATNPQRGAVFGQHVIQWSGSLRTNAEAGTYEIWATGWVEADEYDFNLFAGRGAVAEVAVWGAHLFPARSTGVIAGWPIYMPYAIGNSFHLRPNRPLQGMFWGTYQ